MSQEILNKVAASHLRKEMPHFTIGDTVDVSVKIVEGDKERIAGFEGVVISRRGRGIGESFTVRRIVNNEGVERTFPVHSPKIVDIKVVRKGRSRRAKLYYLRQRVGKATRLKEETRKTGPTQPAAEAAPAVAEQS